MSKSKQNRQKKRERKKKIKETQLTGSSTVNEETQEQDRKSKDYVIPRSNIQDATPRSLYSMLATQSPYDKNMGLQTLVTSSMLPSAADISSRNEQLIRAQQQLFVANSKVIELKVSNGSLKTDMAELKGTILIQEEELDKLR